MLLIPILSYSEIESESNHEGLFFKITEGNESSLQIYGSLVSKLVVVKLIPKYKFKDAHQVSMHQVRPENSPVYWEVFLDRLNGSKFESTKWQMSVIYEGNYSKLYGFNDKNRTLDEINGQGLEKETIGSIAKAIIWPKSEVAQWINGSIYLLFLCSVLAIFANFFRRWSETTDFYKFLGKFKDSAVPAQAIDEIVDKSRDFPGLKSSFKEYADSMILLKGCLTSTQKPEKFFNRNSSEKSYFPEKIIEQSPNWCTSLGITGTFLGLVIGVKGLNLSDPDILLLGIGQLMGGLTTAFSTSIVGVVSALFISISEQSSRLVTVTDPSTDKTSAIRLHIETVWPSVVEKRINILSISILLYFIS